jgi:sterol desaturase/sphingolipid hydroxylase (fatty acid hydroxylase superfamily)
LHEDAKAQRSEGFTLGLCAFVQKDVASIHIFAHSFIMNKEEQDFIKYWSQERLRKRKFLRKLSIGLPLAVLIAVAVMVNLFSGWYQKADMELRSNSSLIIVILIAVIGIVIFITIFSAHHRWDRNESMYQELVQRENREQA